MKGLIAAACIALALPAVAQEGGPSSPPPPPPPSDSPYAPPPTLLDEEHHVTRAHFRWGIDGHIGYFWPAQAVDFGAAVRFGAQITDLIGVYGDIGYTLGVGFSGGATATGGAASISLIGFFHVAPMVEFDFHKYFLAIGPLFGVGGWAQVAQSVDVNGNVTQYALAAGGFLPGIDFRTGFTFGDRRMSEFLGGFTLAIDLKVVNAPVGSVTQTAGPAGASQTVSVGDRVWGVTPMLMLGYDLR